MKTTEFTSTAAGHHASADLRSWLRRLAATGRLAVARNGVSLIDELAAVSKKLELERAVMFPRPGGHPMTVVSNLFVDRSWVADSIGVPTRDLLARFQQAVQRPLPWTEVKDAAAQQVIHHDVDLLKLLPVPKHNEHDSGPYITAALLIARNPKTGVQNVSIHRCQVSGPDRIGVLLLPRHTHYYFRMAEEAGEALEIALVIGVHPACILASQAIAALDEDEMEIAGALMGAPVEMVKCRTNQVRVPAQAEIVIEGRILPGIREPEGPFGEFPQYYGPRANREVIHVDAVTHRRNAIFHTIVGGGMEHLVLGEIPREATLLKHLQRSFPNVRDVRLTRGGICRYHLVVKIDKRSNGEPKNIIMGAFGGHYDVKQVVVVDLDVDIDDPNEIEWAVATRFQADRDLLVVSGAQGSKLDPSSEEGISAKMGIDATKPVEAEVMKFKRIHVKGLEEVDLDSVLQQDAKAAFASLAGSSDGTLARSGSCAIALLLARHNTVSDAILILNAGSSSIKFSVFPGHQRPSRQSIICEGECEGIGHRVHFTAKDRAGVSLISEYLTEGTTHEGALAALLRWLEGRFLDNQLVAAGHRVVHGGSLYAAPVLVDASVTAELCRLIPLAPLHQPHNLAAIAALTKLHPGLPQIACFDTAFHHTQTEVATAFALPRRLAAEGIRRYGFHGLSYEYIASVLPDILGPAAADGRVVVAHLGSGASLCAIHQRKSVATTMSFTALDGLPMSRRCGNVDPGVILYLMQEKAMTAAEVSNLLYNESGLFGVSGVSDDMRTLLASDDPSAKQAVALFVYRIGRELGSMVAALGGIDALVFTAGIGEHGAEIRRRVCEDAAWLGVDPDQGANAAGRAMITRAGSRTSAWVIPTDEDLMIALHAWTLLNPEAASPQRWPG